MADMVHGHGTVHAHAHSFGAEFWLPAMLLALAAALYVFGLLEDQRKAKQWSSLRTVSFMIGIFLLALALSPPVATWAHLDLNGHMVQHLLLGMFAPLALVLGAPGTLLLRCIPVGAARYLVAFLDTKPIRFLIHPVTALVLNMGGMCILYLTPLYALSTQQPTVHFLVHLHFILAGYLFIWAIAGPDPAPHRPSLKLRLAVLFIGTATHAILGKWMYAYGHPRGTEHSLEEIRSAAQLMYYGGDLAELLLAAAFFFLWFRLKRLGTQAVNAQSQQSRLNESLSATLHITPGVQAAQRL